MEPRSGAEYGFRQEGGEEDNNRLRDTTQEYSPSSRTDMILLQYMSGNI